MLPEKEEEGGSKGDIGKGPSSKASKAVILSNTIKERWKWRNWLRGIQGSCEVTEWMLMWETKPRALHAPKACSTQLQRKGSGFSVKHNYHPQVD